MTAPHLNIYQSGVWVTRHLSISILFILILILIIKHQSNCDSARVPICQKQQKLVEDMGLSLKQPTYNSVILREATCIFLSDILKE